MSRTRWALLCGLCTALLTVLLLAVDGRRNRIDERAELGYSVELRRLDTLAAKLDREILRCRYGLAPHYDELSYAHEELRALQERLLQAPAGLGFMPGPELSAALVQVNRLAIEQSQWLQRFKQESSLLHGARQAFPSLLAALAARLQAAPGNEQISAQLSLLMTALASLDAAATPEALARLKGALDGLEASTVGVPSADWSAELAAVLELGRQIAEHSPVVEELVQQLLNVPVAAAVQMALDGYQRAFQDALSRAQLRNVLLASFTGLALLLGVALVLLHLRDNERARQRAERDMEAMQSMLDSASRSLEHERLQQHKRERATKRVDARFVTGISQEFRAPLANILSSSRMLTSYGERWSSERRQEHFDRISAGAVHLKELLEELLVIGYSDQGNLVANPTPFDLQGFCEHLIDTHSRALGPSGEPLSLPTGPGRVRFSYRGDRKVCLDQRLLGHVLGNLLDNALKYSGSTSEVGLHVTVSEADVRCVVQDAGVGIAEDEVPKLFQPFRRGRNVGSVAGSGLGLAVAHRALQAQGGKIEVHSAPGKGSEFVVRLPLTQRVEHTTRAWPEAPVSLGTMELESGEIELLPVQGELSA